MAEVPQQEAVTKSPDTKKRPRTAAETVESSRFVIFVTFKSTQPDEGIQEHPFCFAKDDKDATDKLAALSIEKNCYITAGGTNTETLSTSYFAVDIKTKACWELGIVPGVLVPLTQTGGYQREFDDFDNHIYAHKSRRRLAFFFCTDDAASISAASRRDSIETHCRFWEQVRKTVNQETLEVLNGIYEAGDYRRYLHDKDILVDSSDEGDEWNPTESRDDESEDN